MLYYLPIGLSIKFVTAFGHLTVFPLKQGRLFGQPLPYLRSSVHLPGIKRVPCQFKRGKANPNFDLQDVWGLTGCLKDLQGVWRTYRVLGQPVEFSVRFFATDVGI